MRPVYAIASGAVSALGIGVDAHWNKLMSGRTAIRRYEDDSMSSQPFYGSRLDPLQWQIIQTQTATAQSLSPFERMAYFAGKQALESLEQPLNLSRTVLVLATTKGNIEWLGQEPDDRIGLYSSAKLIAEALGIPHKPAVISHACVSGVTALIHAMRLLQAGQCEHTLVIGCDRFSRFVLSGFQSFQAVADGPCRPFDADRTGINLGEAGAAIILSSGNVYAPLAKLCGGGSSNDANHISGPSRTGEELALAINRAIGEAGISSKEIGMVSAHGTATIYNDEMESKAFALAGLLHAPVHSLKGYVGHTLGAAGVLESAMLIESLQNGVCIPSAGFEKLGVSQPLHISAEPEWTQTTYALKTASGFGGSNAAAVWGKL